MHTRKFRLSQNEINLTHANYNMQGQLTVSRRSFSGKSTLIPVSMDTFLVTQSANVQSEFQRIISTD